MRFLIIKKERAGVFIKKERAGVFRMPVPYANQRIAARN